MGKGVVMGGRERAAGVTRVDHPSRFDEHCVDFSVGDGGSADATRDDEKLTRPSVTLPSRIWIVSCPVTRNNSSVS